MFYKLILYDRIYVTGDHAVKFIPTIILLFSASFPLHSRLIPELEKYTPILKDYEWIKFELRSAKTYQDYINILSYFHQKSLYLIKLKNWNEVREIAEKGIKIASLIDHLPYQMRFKNNYICSLFQMNQGTSKHCLRAIEEFEQIAVNSADASLMVYALCHRAYRLSEKIKSAKTSNKFKNKKLLKTTYISHHLNTARETITAAYRLANNSSDLLIKIHHTMAKIEQEDPQGDKDLEIEMLSLVDESLSKTGEDIDPMFWMP